MKNQAELAVLVLLLMQLLLAVNPAGASTPGTTLTACHEDDCFDVMASLSNGSVERIDVDRDFVSIILTVETSETEDGELTISLPRALIDSTLDGSDEDFIILVDGQEEDYAERQTTDTERALTVPVFASSEEIEIVGTQVIPEFPAAAVMAIMAGVVLAAAIAAASRFNHRLL